MVVLCGWKLQGLLGPGINFLTEVSESDQGWNPGTASFKMGVLRVVGGRAKAGPLGLLRSPAVGKLTLEALPKSSAERLGPSKASEYALIQAFHSFLILQDPGLHQKPFYMMGWCLPSLWGICCTILLFLWAFP